jgi:hypothetical protein
MGRNQDRQGPHPYVTGQCTSGHAATADIGRGPQSSTFRSRGLFDRVDWHPTTLYDGLDRRNNIYSIRSARLKGNKPFNPFNSSNPFNQYNLFHQTDRYILPSFCSFCSIDAIVRIPICSICPFDSIGTIEIHLTSICSFCSIDTIVLIPICTICPFGSIGTIEIHLPSICSFCPFGSIGTIELIPICTICPFGLIGTIELYQSVRSNRFCTIYALSNEMRFSFHLFDPFNRHDCGIPLHPIELIAPSDEYTTRHIKSITTAM